MIELVISYILLYSYSNALMFLIYDTHKLWTIIAIIISEVFVIMYHYYLYINNKKQLAIYLTLINIIIIFISISSVIEQKNKEFIIFQLCLPYITKNYITNLLS